MPKPNLIQIGKRILNLDAVRFIEIEGPHVVNVYLTEATEIQFIEADADALQAVLNDGYVRKMEIGTSGAAKS